MRTIIFGYHQKAAGILINPMDNSRPNDPIDSGKISLAMIQQSIYQSTIIISWCGMYYYPLWFIYNQQVIIFIDNIQGNGLRLCGIIHRLRNMKKNGIACFYLCTL